MFTVIPQDTFEAMQMDAGVLLKTFNPAQPAAPAPLMTTLISSIFLPVRRREFMSAATAITAVPC